MVFYLNRSVLFEYIYAVILSSAHDHSYPTSDGDRISMTQHWLSRPIVPKSSFSFQNYLLNVFYCFKPQIPRLHRATASESPRVHFTCELANEFCTCSFGDPSRALVPHLTRKNVSHHYTWLYLENYHMGRVVLFKRAMGICKDACKYRFCHYCPQNTSGWLMIHVSLLVLSFSRIMMQFLIIALMHCDLWKCLKNPCSHVVLGIMVGLWVSEVGCVYLDCTIFHMLRLCQTLKNNNAVIISRYWASSCHEELAHFSGVGLISCSVVNGRAVMVLCTWRSGFVEMYWRCIWLMKHHLMSFVLTALSVGSSWSALCCRVTRWRCSLVCWCSHSPKSMSGFLFLLQKNFRDIWWVLLYPTKKTCELNIILNYPLLH